MPDDPESSLWDQPPVETPVAWPDLPGVVDGIAQAADHWVNDHTTQFHPFQWGEAKGERAYRRKAFNEAALNLRVAHELGYDDVAPDLEDLVTTWVNDRRYVDLIRRHPRRFIQYAYAALYADARDSLDPMAGDAVEAVLDAGLATFVERRPYVNLMAWQFCECYGYDDHGIDPDAVLASTTISRGIDPVEATLEDAYALTHDVLFGRDFGLADESPLDDIDGPDLGAAVDALVLRFVADGNLDVALELVMAGVLEDAVDPDVVRFALSCVADAVDGRGYVPGPRAEQAVAAGLGPVGDREAAADLESWDGENERWVQNYHPNLVAGAATRLLRERWLDDAPGGDSRLGRDVSAADYHRLGQVLVSLAAYDLETAGRRLEALHGSPVLDDLAGVVDHAVSFLVRQRTADGEFGYWTDERTLYGGLDADESFDEKLLRPTTEACAAALEPFDTARFE